MVGVVDVEIVAFVASATSYVGDTLQKEEEWRRNQPDVMKTLGEWGQDEREREMTDFERENPNILMLNSTSDEFKNMWRDCGFLLHKWGTYGMITFPSNLLSWDK